MLGWRHQERRRVHRRDCAEPGPNEGPPSNGFTECEGSAGCELRLVKSQQSPESFQPGDSFAIELQACVLANGVPGERAWARVCSGADAASVALAEVGDSGRFRIDPGAPGQSGSGVRTWLVEPPDADALDLQVAGTDTVQVSGWSADAPSGPCGELAGCASQFAVRLDPCLGIFPPETPSLAISAAGSCGVSGTGLDLAWTVPEPSATLFYRVFRCSSSNSRGDCSPAADGSKILHTRSEIRNAGQFDRETPNPE